MMRYVVALSGGKDSVAMAHERNSVSMFPHQERVVAEKTELDERLAKLDAFGRTESAPAFDSIRVSGQAATEGVFSGFPEASPPGIGGVRRQRDRCGRGESIRVMHPLFQVGQGGSIPTSPLQLRIEAIDLRLAMQLNRLWHSTLPATHYAGMKAGTHTIAYGAVFDSIIYAVAIWTDPVNRTLANGTTIELRRLAIGPDAPKYTASRLLGVMVRLVKKKWPELDKAISYQACAVHEGTIYKAAGWTNAAFSKFSPWKKRKTRTRDGVFQHKSSDRSPPQIVSDKIRWERRLR